MKKSANVYAPASAVPHSERTTHERIFTLEYFVCAISFTSLLYSSVAGTMAIVGFLAPWGLIALKRFFSLPAVFQKSWALLLLPAWAIASTLWSVEPGWSLRSGLEFTATALVGILAASCIKPKTLIIGLLSALMAIALLCIVKHDALFAVSEDQPMTGIFGSKNAFSEVISLMAFVSIAVLMDKSQPPLFRLASLGGLALTPILLALGRSLDAILSVSFTIIIYLAVRFLARFDHKIRLMISVFILMMGLSLTVVMSFTEFDPAFILGALGKDTTLTGRTHLWNRAVDLIAQRPFLGVGYNAFWRVTNINARELWYDSKAPIGSGFNFHDEFIDAWVALGVVGFGLAMGYFLVLSKRVIKSVLGSMSTEQYFAFLLFIPFVIRAPVETGIFGVFSLSMILFCIVWIYFQPPKKKAVSALGLPGKRKTLAFTDNDAGP